MRLPLNCLLSHQLILAVRHARIDIHDQDALSERLAPVQRLRQLVCFAGGIGVVGGYGLADAGEEVAKTFALGPRGMH